MINAPVIMPRTLAAALAAKADRGVVAIAGGTDILVRLHDCIARPWPKLLVLDKINSLHKINIGEKEISLGPLVTFTEIESSRLLGRYAPQLAAAAALAGSVQIRNRATIGGNIANGSPAGDTIPPLYVLDSVLEISSAKGKRLVAIEEFFRGPGKTILRADELITKIKFPKTKAAGFFLRLGTRRALAISKVSVSALIQIEHQIVKDVKIALGAVAPTVIRAENAEQYLLGKKLDSESIAEAAAIVQSEARPIDDIRSNADYRKAMVGVLLKRGLNSILEKATHARI